MEIDFFMFGEPNDYGCCPVFVPSGHMIGEVSRYGKDAYIFYPDVVHFNSTICGVGDTQEDAVLFWFIHNELIKAGLDQSDYLTE